MPILLVLALTAACLPVQWPEPLIGDGKETAVAFTLAVVCISLFVAICLRTWVIVTLQQSPMRKPEVARVYLRLRRYLFFVNLALSVLCIGVFGWGWCVREWFQKEWDGKSLLA